MTIADKISALLLELKEMPNSKEKKKLLSKLDDAWAWAKVLDGKYKPLPKEPSDTSANPT
jgi:hypothetical protein